jgi:hypothetical protein
MLYVDPVHVARRRDEALAWLGQEAGIDAESDRPGLERALGEVPHDVWLGHSAVELDRVPPLTQPSVAAARATAADVRRRRPSAWLLVPIGAVAAALVAAAALLIGGGEDATGPGASPPLGSGTAPVRLDPLPGDGAARASMRVVRPGPPPRLALSLRPPPDGAGAYEVWLYNSVIDARSLATIPHRGGTVRFTLPESTSGYRYIDVSEERPGGFPGHSGRSIGRVGLPSALAELGLAGG